MPQADSDEIPWAEAYRCKLKAGKEVKKVVLTGGPQAGKTTILKALSIEFANKIIVVPEVASLLLGNGFPAPNKDLLWGEDWQTIFQSVVLSLQIKMEEAYVLMAEQKNISLIICDRGVMDGAAYTLGGVKEFCKRYHINAQSAMEEYVAVVHLESIAMSQPDFYGNDGNDVRYEDVSRARDIERRTRAAWKGHSRYRFIAGCDSIVEKIDQVLKLVEGILAET